MKEAGIEADFATLDFNPIVPGQCDQSLAGIFVGKSIKGNGGDRALRAYELGGFLENARLRAGNNEYTPSVLGPGYYAPGEISILNKKAGYFHVNPISTEHLEDDLNSTNQQENMKVYNHRLWLAFVDLDSNVQQKL